MPGTVWVFFITSSRVGPACAAAAANPTAAMPPILIACLVMSASYAAFGLVLGVGRHPASWHQVEVVCPYSPEASTPVSVLQEIFGIFLCRKFSIVLLNVILRAMLWVRVADVACPSEGSIGS